MKTIILANNKGEVLLDDDDFDALIIYKWSKGSDGYARGWIHGKKLAMHRLIMSAGAGQQVDHINRNKLDNQRKNLRFCTPSQNNANSYPRSSSGFKGVIWNKEKHKWMAQIKTGSKNIYLGYFTNPVDGARAYDIAAIELFGKFAGLNFPVEGYGQLKPAGMQI